MVLIVPIAMDRAFADNANRSAADMQMKNPKIHFYTLHAGDHPGDFYTNVTGLVTCKTCLRLLKGSRRTSRAVDGGQAGENSGRVALPTATNA